MTGLKLGARFETDRRHAAGQAPSTTARPGQGSLVGMVFVRGSLRAPITSELSQTVEASLRRGAGRVVLDLSGLVDIDAAGVGELLRAFKAVSAVAGVLRITHAHRRVRRVLEVAGVFTLLAGSAQEWPVMNAVAAQRDSIS